jgi:pyridoxal phosphate enzyme (YggS family)
METIATRLALVKANIADACIAVNRNLEDVKLIAVSKKKPVSDILEAVAEGQVDFGENYVQELVEKHKVLPDLNWHMIGKLQRNKVKQIVGFIYLVHSVDSKALLSEINKEASKMNRMVSVLLQINISDELQKEGMTTEEASEILLERHNFPNIRFKGFMGMASFTDDLNIIKNQFNDLKIFSDKMVVFKDDQTPINELSMGMSGDFEIAIEAGSTYLRIGSSIFGERK